MVRSFYQARAKRYSSVHRITNSTYSTSLYFTWVFLDFSVYCSLVAAMPHFDVGYPAREMLVGHPEA
jgi:hypothetical protein